MNTTVQGPLGRQEVVTQESLLLEAAERIGKIRHGRIALRFHLSELRQQNREDGYLRIALRMLEQSLDNYRGQLFLLANSDIVLLCKDARVSDLDSVIQKLRGLFSKDPLTYVDDGDGVDRFATWYELDYDYDSFLATCQRLASEAKQTRKIQAERQQILPLDAKALSVLQNRLKDIDMTPVIRRQSALGIAEKSYAEVVFQEFFVSMADLQRAVAPDINLLANRWLFQHFSQMLDQKVLQTLNNLRNLSAYPHTYSLNLNLATVHTPAFKTLAKSLAGRANIVVEVQIVDIFVDIQAYFAARDFLRSQGHRVLIDSVNALTLQFMDLTQFGADLLKLSWSPEFTDPESRRTLSAALDPVGYDRVVLARCDSEASVKWGLAQGIRQFQGRYMDAMLGAVTMAGCDKAKALNCTLQQCVNRRGVVAGPLRGECGNHVNLDGSPRVAAPR